MNWKSDRGAATAEYAIATMVAVLVFTLALECRTLTLRL
jgi:hypothetical protein